MIGIQEYFVKLCVNAKEQSLHRFNILFEMFQAPFDLKLHTVSSHRVESGPNLNIHKGQATWIRVDQTNHDHEKKNSAPVHTQYITTLRNIFCGHVHSWKTRHWFKKRSTSVSVSIVVHIVMIYLIDTLLGLICDINMLWQHEYRVTTDNNTSHNYILLEPVNA